MVVGKIRRAVSKARPAVRKVRGDRRRLAVVAIVFALLVGGMELLALKLGSFDVPFDGVDDTTAGADHSVTATTH
ncbi:hypothetical protein DZF91_16540 [Actinomadura logoneensis]|uniref:Uncharacterized protein n=2 Tax=Actinomadura logoneensis TaxID=2293572 RepID=A0A372JKK0_9ACTN|nr:hypothetical protein DZF91_16540 [Actinomadura logoneensis]